ncbi:hypothetical protein IV203_025848 [Nitzschia inconspicua]|uniref:Uncharacterized protein n=1 Tax=Nitzschia inconspicua TaxID=303405 RepID=A0A9K3PBL4_9STRA|nr:hypothetical protein IV203_017696 [Nitzschia inconspicua]KAG7362182.1 hypothetical protein IV203_025848 [Nitzschia inconspicua]
MDRLRLETKDLPLQQQIDRFHQWLHENPDHVNYSTVQWLLDEKQQRAQEIAEKEQLQQQLAEEMQQHAQEKEQHAQEKEQLLQKLHAASLKSLKEEFLAISDRTSSGPHLSENHKHAEVQQIDNLVDCLNNLEKNWLDDRFWETSCVPHKQFRECYKESEAQGLVSYILKTLIVALKLSDYIDVVHNATLAGIECDILLVYRPNYLPFAVIEVKKPCNCQEHRLQLWQGKIPEGLKTRQNVVAGQIFDSMSAIRLFGFPNLYGMIATGNQFRLVGTYSGEDPNDRVMFDKELLNEIKKDTSSGEAIAAVLKEFQGWTDDTSSECITTYSPEQPSVVLSQYGSGQTDELANRVVWASEIVPSFEDLKDEDDMIEKVRNSGAEILSLVVLFVVKGCQMLTAFLKSRGGPQLLSPSITIRPKMPCRILQTNERIFSFGSVQVNSLNLNKYKATPPLFVIHHLGMGEYGNCCLAVSRYGTSCCAVKFFHRVDGRDRLAMEELERMPGIESRGGFVLGNAVFSSNSKDGKEKGARKRVNRYRLEAVCKLWIYSLRYQVASHGILE